MFDAISGISPIEQYCIHENWKVQLEGGGVYFVKNSRNFSHLVSSSVNATAKKPVHIYKRRDFIDFI